jgi:hypothetical protein
LILMCPEPSDEQSIRTTAEEDAKWERAVLAVVLSSHPAQITEAELVRELADDPDDFATRDGAVRAIGDLVGVGLLHRSGDFVLPTRAAIHADSLWGETS